MFKFALFLVVLVVFLVVCGLLLGLLLDLLLGLLLDLLLLLLLGLRDLITFLPLIADVTLLPVLNLPVSCS